jgi:hypothetical protein
MMLMSRRKMIAAIAAGPNMPVKNFKLNIQQKITLRKEYIYIYIYIYKTNDHAMTQNNSYSFSS